MECVREILQGEKLKYFKRSPPGLLLQLFCPSCLQIYYVVKKKKKKYICDKIMGKHGRRQLNDTGTVLPLLCLLTVHVREAGQRTHTLLCFSQVFTSMFLWKQEKDQDCR